MSTKERMMHITGDQWRRDTALGRLLDRALSLHGPTGRFSFIDETCALRTGTVRDFELALRKLSLKDLEAALAHAMETNE